MTWKPPNLAPEPGQTWKDPDCHCGRGHRLHEGWCPQAGCSCHVEPPACPVCLHRLHFNSDCYAGGIKDTACICKGEGKTTRRELQEHEISLGRVGAWKK